VTVGATRQAPNQEAMASYSSRGPTNDSRRKPTLTLPGGDSGLAITSARNNTGNPPASTCMTVGSPFYGTSMATPAVAGTALLVRQYFEEGFYPSGQANAADALSPSGALIKAALLNSAADMGTADIPNYNEGWGRVLLEDVLYFPDQTRELRVEDAGGIVTAQSDDYVYDVEAGEPLEVVLVWSDFPGTQGAGLALVNDLNLEVVGPGGTFLGNVFAGGESVTGGSADSRNVEEVVRLANPAAGAYTIRVTGQNVPQGPQPYALVSTGAFANWPMIQTAVVESIPATGGAVRLAVQPNPANGDVSLRMTRRGSEPASVRLEIYDLRGARVALAWQGPIAPGETAVEWDRRDESGRRVPAGIYFARLSGPSAPITRKLVLLR
jgi:subtilisin family serine protease